jgi:hypothetical protein
MVVFGVAVLNLQFFNIGELDNINSFAFHYVVRSVNAPV